ncbi:MAG: elongation factor P maturation arginine rhamnosyltransferase EarP [Polaromonas sp.]|nr:MAG: elongation factor P maturation arginine rhamnosyltransferase EarP [Polaromonas sp.]
MRATPDSLQWDIFCKVIDNFGDIGVCWRLAADLAGRGHRVRLWVDDASALAWMAPGGCAGVRVLSWTTPLAQTDLNTLDDHPGDVLLEAFGCEIAPEFIASSADRYCRSGLKPVWINLEYLSAEAYAERNHGLPSTLSVAQGGAAAGWTKWFFYPGFTVRSGGLLREPGLAQRQAAFDRTAWLGKQGIVWAGEKLVSLFCYEPSALPGLLRELANTGIHGQQTRLLVAAGRAQGAVSSAAAALGLTAPQRRENIDKKSSHSNACKDCMLSILYLPLLAQADFDHLLWACDLNFVRGEDSVVRAIWAGKPFVWQIYAQDDGVHGPKLAAFLAMLGATPSLQTFHSAWNGLTSNDRPAQGLPAIDLKDWANPAQTARQKLGMQPDLVTQLLDFVNARLSTPG